MEIKFSVRARGVIVKEGKILLVRAKGGGNTFLPGGGVEMGEKAADTNDFEKIKAQFLEFYNSP